MVPARTPPLVRSAADVEWQTHRGRTIDRVDDFDVIDCEPCGFRHVVPLPTAEEIRALYTTAYYGETKPDYLVRANADAAWARLGFDDRLDLLEQNLPASRRRLLEIGSGPGHFLAHAAARGWDALGVDPSEQACAHARGLGLSVVHGFFDEHLAATLPPCDAVVLTNVLEHIADPLGLLQTARHCLKAGGLACVSVPNDYNAFQTTLRSAAGYAPWWVAAPHHLNYFDFAALERLVRRVGLQPVARLTSFPMEIFALMGEAYPGNDTLGRLCHARRKAFDTLLEAAGAGTARRDFYRALAGVGLGREAIVIARKDI